MKRLIASIACVIVLIVGCLSLMDARAQTLESPPTVSYWQASPALRHVRASLTRGCAVWFVRQSDRYAGWMRGLAAVDLTVLAADQAQALAEAVSAQDAIPLIAGRTHRIDSPQLAPAAAPCLGIETPPGPWVIAPIASGSRPMYAVNADGTLGAATGERATAGVRADCRTRVVRASAVYCAVAGDVSGAVALAREIP